MVKSAFWGDFARRFRKLQNECRDPLEACWIASEGGATEWRLRGSTESARRWFIWLADRAAVELGHKAGSGWSDWLDLLRRDSPNHQDIALQGFDSDGAEVMTGAGTIYRLCEASARYCVYCEGRMISARRRKHVARMLPVAGVTPMRSLRLGEPATDREKPGPKAGVERASRIAEIVAEIPPGESWKNHWEDLCEDFDRAQIPPPRAWKQNGFRSWSDCDDRQRVLKAIMYQVDLAKKKIVILA